MQLLFYLYHCKPMAALPQHSAEGERGHSPLFPCLPITWQNSTIFLVWEPKGKLTHLKIHALQ